MFVGDNTAEDVTIGLGIGLIGYLLWDAYRAKKEEAQSAQDQVQAINSQVAVETDEQMKQELLGQKIVAEQNYKNSLAQLDILESRIANRANALPPEKRITLPGEVLQVIENQKWYNKLIAPLLIIGGVIAIGGMVWSGKKLIPVKKVKRMYEGSTI